jgi:hypothetical protein
MNVQGIARIIMPQPTESSRVGTPTRLAIQKAYAYAELRLLSVGCGIIILAIPSSDLWLPLQIDIFHHECPRNRENYNATTNRK